LLFTGNGKPRLSFVCRCCCRLTEPLLCVSSTAPLVNLKKVLVRMKQELAVMDVRVGVASHILLQSRLKQSTALQHLLLANSSTNFK